MKYAGSFLKAPYNYSIKNLNIRSISLPVGLGNDILFRCLQSSVSNLKPVRICNNVTYYAPITNASYGLRGKPCALEKLTVMVMGGFRDKNIR